MIKSLYDISDISDVPNYKNNKSLSKARLREAILFLLKDAKKPLTSKHLRVAYYRKYNECRGFFDLSVTQVSLLLRNLITQGKIICIERGVYKYNNDFVKNEKISIDKDFNFTDELLNIFPKNETLTKREIRLLIKEKIAIKVPESVLSSRLHYLKRRGYLNYKNHFYELNSNKFVKKEDRYKNKIDKNSLIDLINEGKGKIFIAQHFHVSPDTLKKYLQEENLKIKGRNK